MCVCVLFGGQERAGAGVTAVLPMQKERVGR